MSGTPASRIASPPMPTRWYGAFRAHSSLATPAACRSPDASPATKRMSRTGGDVRASGERRQCTLDLADDGQRHRERLTSVLPSDDDRRAALYRGEKALELE